METKLGERERELGEKAREVEEMGKRLGLSKALEADVMKLRHANEDVMNEIEQRDDTIRQLEQDVMQKDGTITLMRETIERLKRTVI